MINNIIKGDSINLEATLNKNITGWKIRCEFYDKSSHCIKLATLNSGGSNTQIEVTDFIQGTFIIHVAKTLTACFDDKAFIEIEVENTSAEVFTVYQDNIVFNPQRIEWEAP